MLKALGIAQPTLTIKLQEDSYYLRPNPDPALPSEDVVIKGSLTLVLPKPKKIKSIAVKVVTHYNIQFPNFVYESGESALVEEQIQTSEEERLYDKGEHLFSFALIAPSSSATFDKSVYGRILHTVNAKVQGEGMIGSSIEANVPVYLVTNPAPVGEASDLNLRVEGFHEQLGPYSLSTAAQHLTVGGLLHFDALLASVPQHTQILSVSATLLAHYTIRSIQNPSQAPQFAHKKTKLFVFDANNPPCTDSHGLAGDMGGCRDSFSVVGDGSCCTTGATSPLLEPSTRGVVNSTSGSQSSNSQASTSQTSSPSPGPPLVRPPATAMLNGHHPSTRPSPSTTQGKGKEPPRPMATVQPGGSYQVTHLARLPNDDIIRPSTLDGTKTPIETKHELLLEILFSSGEAESQSSRPLVLRTTHPITLSSCCCWLTSLLVPAYSEALTSPVLSLSKSPLTTSFWETKYADVCICMATKEELLKQYRAADERLRAEHNEREWRNGGLGTTTVVSWDDLSGQKFEYERAGRA
ncbi:hypothetical protein DL93DRAFT_2098870 [Clavulina sp. PMI_390]|nr:hypothetical protein DL93DRAFT_2098870 [Clavulina sp. PMI_390]